MVDDAKKPFEEAAKNIRDKDNAEPRPTPPTQVRQPAPNVGPSGMKGIQTTPRQLPNQKREGAEKLPSIVKTHSKPELLTGGRFTDKPDYGFAIEINPYQSFFGIEGGKIYSLEIQKQGEIVAQYKDMQWTKKPDKEEDTQLVQRLQDKFGEPRKDFIPIMPVPDKDRGHER